MKAKLAELLGENSLTECRTQLKGVTDDLRRMKRLASLLERYSPPSHGPTGNPAVDTGALAILLVNTLEGMIKLTSNLLTVIERRSSRPD